jgi:hypothetical protein
MLGALPLGLLGLILGVIGVIVALAGQRSGLIPAIVGSGLSLVAMVAAVAITGSTAKAVSSALEQRIAQTHKPAPIAKAAPGPESGPCFEIVQWQLIPATNVDMAKVAGEVRNVGTRAMGVQLQTVVRDPEERVIGTDDFWPASIENIAPGGTFAFSMRVDARPEDKVELRIIGQRAW